MLRTRLPLVVCSVFLSSNLSAPSFLHRETIDDSDVHPCTQQKRFVPGCPELLIFSGNANRPLASEIAKNLGTNIANAEVSRFADGEVKIEINDNVRGKDIYIIQSCAAPVNESIMEVLLLASTFNRANAKRVTAVIPYFGYKHRRRGSPINASINSRFLWSHSADFARMLEVVGVDRVIAVDLQRPGQGHEACFFSPQLPVESVMTNDLLLDFLSSNIRFERPVMVVSPNGECIKMAQKFRRELKNNGADVKLGTFITARNSDAIEYTELIGDVNGCDVILVDDFIDTGRTIQIVCKKLKEKGAQDIYVCASHAALSEKVIHLIDESDAKLIITTNTLPLPTNVHSSKIVQISVGKRLAQVIMAEHYKAHLYNAESTVFDSQFS